MHASLTIYVAIPISRQIFFTATGETVNRCANGHIGDNLDAKFCQECGQRFKTEPKEAHSERFTKVCEQYGWPSPTAGFEALLGHGKDRWHAQCAGEGDGSTVFQILLTPINVEAAYDGDEAQVYGLAIHIARLSAIGDGDLTSKVLELPLEGFPRQAATLKGVAALLGAEGEPALYPQVSLS